MEAQFQFSQVFNEGTTQAAFFRATTLPLVQATLHGRSSLLFTYGVTNSGKTHTVQGTPLDGGILPRALDVLFNSVADQLATRDNIVTIGFNQIERVSATSYAALVATKQACLAQSAKEDERAILAALSTTGNSAGAEVELAEFSRDAFDVASRMADGTRLPADAQSTYALFVSYAEVYNENVYDLLERPPRAAGMGQPQRRPALRLVADNEDNVFVRGLRELPVSSVDEALRLLNVGRRNRRVAATQSNTESSRSHCIFTIKLARVPRFGPVVVSRLTIVDLAGSERYSKSQTSGQQLREAGNINQSLMVLGRCIEALRWNQAHPAR
jgi:kinesin family protein 20